MDIAIVNARNQPIILKKINKEITKLNPIMIK